LGIIKIAFLRVSPVDRGWQNKPEEKFAGSYRNDKRSTNKQQLRWCGIRTTWLSAHGGLSSSYNTLLLPNSDYMCRSRSKIIALSRIRFPTSKSSDHE